ncbi:hypothetical protein [Streptomyces sp. TLI_105]|uniref:hypothetical protein n=1 Tax=Streptomyces sp. TLI_105 TaxID=1881019 RepID=UPI00089773C3|nr:hypothetical protein [Streptomyces sp. TLI_105]SEE10569.1 hypothetical protein SAMN05428939_7361 [Streptomyces sp. TLI_105]
MLPDYYPYIRDTVTITENLNEFCTRPSIGPVFLIGRLVQHAPGCNLRVTRNRVIIVADVYDGTNGMIDASATDRGGPGGIVTVMCRRSINARASASGGGGTAGTAGTAGSPGTANYHSDGYYETITDPDGTTHDVWHDEVDIPGADPTNGTPGGPGGPGGNGGSITFTSIEDETPPDLSAPGGWGGPGGPGGPAAQGPYSEGSLEGDPGEYGPQGADGQVNITTLDESAYVAGLQPLLNSTGRVYTNYWAPYRIVTGEYYYHLYNPGVPNSVKYGALAAIEFQRALELQPNNPDAIRLHRQLVGYAPTPGAAWVGGGANALGLPPDMDVVPNFDKYIEAFTRFLTPVLDFLSLGVEKILLTKTIANLADIAGQLSQQAVAAREDADRTLGIAKTEQTQADSDVAYAQAQLDQATTAINRAIVEAQQHHDPPSISFGDVVATVAEVGGAVLGVAAAIPTGGASLVAMAPSLMTLADTVFDNAAPIAQALLRGEEADLAKIREVYNTVGQDASAAISSARTVVNFTTVAQRLAQATTTQNSPHVALIKRGTELTHELLLARNRAVLARQRVDAGTARLARAQTVAAQADALQQKQILDAEAIKQAGLLAVSTAQSKADALLSLAFRAKRSVEIYTLKNEDAHFPLDAGRLSPDIWTDYYEREIDEIKLATELTSSWGDILDLVEMQADYIEYFDKPLDQDWIRRSFKPSDPQVADLKSLHRFTFTIDPVADVPADRFDAKIKSIRLALIGATHPEGEISCQIRHDGKYQQRRADNSVTTQWLLPKISTRGAKTTPLLPDEGFGDDPPLDAPKSLAFWGRGVGGNWQVIIPQQQFDTGLNLSGLTQIQLWIGYQFLHN